MKRRREREKNITVCLLGIYLALLSWIVLFKMQFSLEDLPQIRNVNLIPYGDSMIVNGAVDTSELINNVLAFLPLGLYIGMLKPEWPFWKKLLPIAGLSLIYETFQFVFGIGATDITDLINNTLGGAIGILILCVLSVLWRQKTVRILNRIGMIATALLLLFLFLIFSISG